MPLIFKAESYYLPIKLMATSKEKEDVKHAILVCELCKKADGLSNFCSNCKKETSKIKFYANGEKEDVGSRDMWDIERVDMNEIRLSLIQNWKWLELAEMKKPKASEMAKFREAKEKLGKSPTLEDLFQDMLQNHSAFRGKIVLHSKVNEIYFMPYRNGFTTIIAGITDGNEEFIPPKMVFELPEAQKVEAK